MTDHVDTPVLDHAPAGAEIPVVAEALAVIDDALAKWIHRDLVATSEVADLLLDLRTLLSSES